MMSATKAWCLWENKLSRQTAVRRSKEPDLGLIGQFPPQTSRAQGPLPSRKKKKAGLLPETATSQTVSRSYLWLPTDAHPSPPLGKS